MGQVQDKVAIVTGGASGIGAACAATLAREGAKVIVTDLDDPRGQVLVDKIGSDGGEAVYLHQDVSLEESWPGVIDAAERRFGGAAAVGRTRANTICRIADPMLVARPRQLRDASPVMRFQPAHQRMINRRHDGRASCLARQSLKQLLPREPRIDAPAP
jgi:NAD(P)-dependent dehydrogenase (short-subunit alcohol dehydrogenase family)